MVEEKFTMTLRSRTLATFTAAGIILAISCLALAQAPTTPAAKTGYAPVNGLNLYYEIHGTGEPLILLHGGVVGIGACSARTWPRYPGSGRSSPSICRATGTPPISTAPMSFEAMADDIAALMKYLGIDRADVMGYSLGGGVALQTAIRHPELVRKLVVVSTPFKRDGWYPEILAGMARWVPQPPSE